MPRRKGDRDISPRLRQQLMKGLEMLAEQRNQTLAELLRDRWDDDFVATGNLLVKMLPREHDVTADIFSGGLSEDGNASKKWLEQQIRSIELGVPVEQLPEPDEDDDSGDGEEHLYSPAVMEALTGTSGSQDRPIYNVDGSPPDTEDRYTKAARRQADEDRR